MLVRNLALRNSFARDVSQSLIRSSSNLKLGETIGQGKIIPTNVAANHACEY